MTTTDPSSTSQTSSPPADPGATPPAAVAAPEPAPAAAAPAKVESAPIEKPADPAPSAVAKPAEPIPAVVAPALPDLYEIKGSTDPAFAKALSPAFKAAGLTQEKADGIVSTFLQFQAQMPQQLLARDLEVVMKDPELGGLNWGKTQGQINEALTAFTTPEFRQKLERWGIANDLEFVRVFASIGKAMRGDSPSRGEPTTMQAESRADRIYGRAQKIN